MPCMGRNDWPPDVRRLADEEGIWYGCEEPERMFDGVMSLWLFCPSCLMKAKLVLAQEGEQFGNNPLLPNLTLFIQEAEKKQKERRDANQD